MSDIDSCDRIAMIMITIMIVIVIVTVPMLSQPD